MDRENSWLQTLAEVASQLYEEEVRKDEKSEFRKAIRFLRKAVVWEKPPNELNHKSGDLALKFSTQTINEPILREYECMFMPSKCSFKCRRTSDRDLPVAAKLQFHMLKHIDLLREFVDHHLNENFSLETFRLAYEGCEAYCRFLGYDGKRLLPEDCTPNPESGIADYDILLPTDSRMFGFTSSFSYLSWDHSYSRRSRNKEELNAVEDSCFNLTDEEKDSGVENSSSNCWPPVGIGFKMKPQFAYRSSFAFPHVHDPNELMQVAQVEEVSADGTPVDRFEKRSCLSHSGCNGHKTAKRHYCDTSKHVLKDCTGSVLVGVENRGKLVSRVRRKPRRFIEANDNCSDLENVQKALKGIDDLRANSKKRIAEPLTCDVCYKVFTVRSTLESHYKSHAGIKEHRCPTCNRAFSRRFTLNYHMMVHLDQSRFNCVVCNKEFRHPNHYKNHEMNHNAPFSCRLCESIFQKYHLYKKHLVNVHNKVISKGGNLRDKKVKK